MGYFLTVIAGFCSDALAGVGLHGVFSLAGIFFLGIPVVMKISVYALAIAQRAGVPPEIAFIFAIIAAIAVGIIFAYLFVKVSPDSFAVLGLASLLACESLLQSWDSVTNGILGISGIRRPELFSSLPSLVIIYVLAVAVFFLLEWIFLRTRYGRLVRAYKQNEIVLQALGHSSSRIGQLLIIAASFIYGVVGILMAWRIQFVDPSIAGIPYLIEIVTIGVLALNPRVSSLAAATFFVAVFPEVLRFFNPPTAIMGYSRVLLYSIFLMVIIGKLLPKLSISNRST